MKIDLKDCKTSAQAMTTIGYNEPTRNLYFRVRCEGLEDLKECVKIIEAYNDFDCNRITGALDKFASFKRWYNPNNPNNGQDVLTFEIGREGSPVLYISWMKFGNEDVKYLKTEDSFGIFTDELFEESMENLEKRAKADECHIDPEGWRKTCRLWWD